LAGNGISPNASGHDAGAAPEAERAPLFGSATGVVVTALAIGVVAVFLIVLRLNRGAKHNGKPKDSSPIKDSLQIRSDWGVVKEVTGMTVSRVEPLSANNNVKGRERFYPQFLKDRVHAAKIEEAEVDSATDSEVLEDLTNVTHLADSDGNVVASPHPAENSREVDQWSIASLVGNQGIGSLVVGPPHDSTEKM